AIRYPESVSGLYLLWISGGWLGLAVLANHYYFDSAFAAVSGGMEAVSVLPEWHEQLQLNPGNRERLLALDPEEFIATMQRWAGSFFPRSEAPVPGLDPDELANIKAPTVILRSGKSDLHHTRETSEQLHKMMPGSDLREPPWGDNEWNEAMVRSEVDDALFKSWPQLAPDIIRFTKTI
ncbi:MAG: alpha/beta hydrolase, partial [Sphingomonadaceae bacterium]|nr:alpha/beta hydrolase [Sphingomonadaceae bacterium]